MEGLPGKANSCQICKNTKIIHLFCTSAPGYFDKLLLFVTL